MFKILDGREQFYQWDLDRKLIVSDESIDEVHFCNRTDDCSLICEVYQEGELRLVNVPNVLLTTDWRINVYAYDSNYTKHCEQYEVVSRTKPADYVYTETEVKNYDELLERLTEIEEKGISDEVLAAAVERYLEDNNIDVDVDLTGYATEEFVNEKIETIELTPGPQGPQGPAGKDGVDGAQGPQGPQGERGPRGLQGEQGPQGEMGPEGPQGPRGLQGERGYKGDTGEQGPKGDTGATGPKGETGPQGPAGKDGQDYVLTAADKQEIAGMVEVTGGGSGAAVEEVYVGLEAPTDPNIKLWIDVDGHNPYATEEYVDEAIAATEKYVDDAIAAIEIPEASGGDHPVKAGEGTNSVMTLGADYASGSEAIAFGSGAKAGANYAFAVGVSANASMQSSVAIGRGANANAQEQTVIGAWNKTDATKTFIIGNGTVSKRVSAMTVDANNKVHFPGTVVVGANEDEIATKAYINEVLGVIENGTY